jgi:hypothetical protein
MKYKFLKGLVVSFALAVSGLANAGIINSEIYMVGYGQGDLFEYDNGVVSTISDPSQQTLRNGLAYNPYDDLMYGLNSNNWLYSIDLVTGVRSNIVELSGGGFVTGLAFDTSSSTLYTNSNSGNLGIIDVTTGAVSTVGSFATSAWMIDISMDTNNNLYGVGTNGQLFQIDKNTGLSTQMFSDITSNIRSGNDWGFTGFAIDEYDDFYGVTISGDKLVKLDTTLGTSSIIYDMGQHERDVRGMSFARQVTDVPEPSTLAVFALSLMGLASRKFKKHA